MKLRLALTAALLYSFVPPVSAMQAPAAATAGKASKKAPDATPAPSDADIAAAKAKGMVWVNTGTGVYHSGGEFYGKTKRGKFMTTDDANKAGFKAAKEPAAKKTKAKADAPATKK